MNQLLTQLQNNSFTLLVSLPRNDIELAQAALNGGAQGLKVHVNVEHFASGTRFGSWNDEREAIRRIVELAGEKGASVGIVPGALSGTDARFATEDEFEEMAQIGVDYFDAYPADAPAWTLRQKHLDVMMAASHGSDVIEMQTLLVLGMTLCEASIMPHEEYGQPLNARDLARLSTLSQAIDAPVIVPSQKKLTPHDVDALQHSGARGVLIGAVVTGREAASIEAATRTFATRINHG
ncbi:MAG TPA: hypothetical protein VM821_04525 [Abditibacteriaceae bacterium]|nr:hypothetical protein [Abditibacteriaceae bacterium]